MTPESEGPARVPPGPAIAVVVPVRNGAVTIAEALESALDQTCSPGEIVVVDDGSTDETCRIVSRFAPRVRLLGQAAGGAGAARNAGVAATTMPWVAFLDADDRWVPDALERLSAPLVDDPDIDVVLGRQRVVPAAQWAEALAGSLDGPFEIRASAGPGSVLIRRTLFDATGGFATGWQVGEFMDWHLRATDRGARTARIADVVQWRRVHDANTAITRRESYGDYARIIKAALDRRRAGGGGD